MAGAGSAAGAVATSGAGGASITGAAWGAIPASCAAGGMAAGSNRVGSGAGSAGVSGRAGAAVTGEGPGESEAVTDERAGDAAAASSETIGMARILRKPLVRSTWTFTDPDGEVYGNSWLPSSPRTVARSPGRISRSRTSICWRVAASADTERRLLPMVRVTFCPEARTSSSALYL